MKANKESTLENKGSFSLNRRFSHIQYYENRRFSYNSLDSFSSFEVPKRLQKCHESDEEDVKSDVLTYEESELRLISLGVISSIILLTCATAFLSIGQVSH